MFGLSQLRRIILILTILSLTNILVLYSIYQHVTPSFSIPAITGGLSFLLAVFFVIVSSYSFSSSFFNLERSLLPIKWVIIGLGFSLFFAWDDILMQSNELYQPWFWGMAVSSYSGWLIGVVIGRAFVIRTQSKMIGTPEYDELIDKKIRHTSQSSMYAKYLRKLAPKAEEGDIDPLIKMLKGYAKSLQVPSEYESRVTEKLVLYIVKTILIYSHLDC